MVSKQELMNMLIEALSFEEIAAMAPLEEFLRNYREIEIGDRTRPEHIQDEIRIEEKVKRIRDETVQHSKMLTALLKRVVGSDQNEY